MSTSPRSCKGGGHATRCVDDSGYCSGCRAAMKRNDRIKTIAQSVDEETYFNDRQHLSFSERHEAMKAFRAGRESAKQ